MSCNPSLVVVTLHVHVLLQVLAVQFGFGIDMHGQDPTVSILATIKMQSLTSQVTLAVWDLSSESCCSGFANPDSTRFSQVVGTFRGQQ